MVELPLTLAPPERVAEDPAGRAADLHRAFADPTIAGVISTIGGDDSIRLLPHLDLALLAANPKVFLGYSDSTIVHMALRRAGVASFYGPSVMAGFGENAGLHPYLIEGVRSALFDPVAPLDWPPNTDGWTVEHLDWEDPSTQEQPRRLEPSTGWRWHGGMPGRGPALVGCLEVLDWLRGTAFWPDLDGVVLFLESSEEASPPSYLTGFLRALAASGELGRIAGLVLGRPGGALNEQERLAYDDALLGVVRQEEGLDALPVVTGVDFGHTDPIWTIPQGIPVAIGPDVQRITFLEAGVT